MKNYFKYIGKIQLIITFTLIAIVNVSAQDHESEDNNTGNWEDAGTWAIGDGVITNNDVVNIYGQVNRNSDLFIDNLAELNVFDTLIIYGNLEVGNNGVLNIKNGAILIVYGNALMNNRVEVDLDSYFIVFGDYDQENNSDINAPADDTLLYVSGGTSCGNGATCVDGDLIGDEDDMYDNPDIDEIIEATSNFITPRVPTFCAGGSVVLSIRDDGDPDSYEWFETSDPTTILSTGPTLTVSAVGTYDVYFEIDGVEQAVTPVSVSSSGTATHTITGVVTNESGVGVGDGEIDITVTGASDPIYDWSNGETTEDITDLSAGDYTVEVEDNGCRVAETFSVGDGSCTDPSLSTVTEPEICNGASYDLSNIVVVDANSTNPTYTYHSGTPALPGNVLGSTTVSPATTTTYYILGTNGSCTNELAVDVIVNPLPTATLTVNVALDTICDGDNTEISVDFTAGTGPFDFTISEGSTPENLTNISADPYTYIPTTSPIWSGVNPNVSYTYTITTITDANSCTNTNQGSTIIIVYKIPETGPQYHIPNDFGN